MKRYAAVIAAIAMSIVVPASWAQSGGMGGMGGKGGMDMKDMDMGKHKQGNDKQGKAPANASQAKLHKGAGTVTAVDNAKGKVTIAHGPVPTLKWPAMTMAFGVKDKALLEKLSTGKQVEFEFIQQGSDYTITAAK